jgi:hypothetical protein
MGAINLDSSNWRKKKKPQHILKDTPKTAQLTDKIPSVN